MLKEGESTERANDVMVEVAKTVEAASLDAVTSAIECGEPSREIRTDVKENAIDLAMLGTHGETDFSRYVMGSVSAKIVRTSPVPVMWVRGPGSDDSS